MSLSDPRPPAPKPSIAGTVALIVVGLLIFVPSGLCTGIMALGPLIVSILNPRAYQNPLEPLLYALMFGGPFVLIGGAMLWQGIKRWRTIRRGP
jgi:hypothetical protein